MTIYFGPYPARVVFVYDGDTILLDIDLGFDHQIAALDFNGKRNIACRVYGINAPELNTEAGIKAREFAESLLPVGSRVTVVSKGWDKYGGRFDGVITLPDGSDFATKMLEAEQAVVYKN